MRTRSIVMLMISGVGLGCRQPNPDWLGPTSESGDGDPTSSSTTIDPQDGSEGATTPSTTADSTDTGEPTCQGDGDCAEPTPSCIDGICVPSGDGMPCSSDSTCTPAAPFCNPDGQCQDGSEGDPCAGNGPTDCSEAAPHCAMDGTCYDGSPGDPCNVNPHCMSGMCEDDVCG